MYRHEGIGGEKDGRVFVKTMVGDMSGWGKETGGDMSVHQPRVS